MGLIQMCPLEALTRHGRYYYYYSIIITTTKVFLISGVEEVDSAPVSLLISAYKPSKTVLKCA